MYKIKAKSNMTIIIGDIDLIVTDRVISVDDAIIENSNDINKVKKYLIIEHDSEIIEENTEEKAVNNSEELANKIYTKDIEKIDDNIVLEEEKQYEKFIANHEEKVETDKPVETEDPAKVVEETEVVEVQPVEEKVIDEVKNVINNTVDTIKNLSDSVTNEEKVEAKETEVKVKETKTEEVKAEKPKRNYKRRTKDAEK